MIWYNVIVEEVFVYRHVNAWAKQYQVTVVHILLDDNDIDWVIFDMETDFARQFDQHSERKTCNLTKVCSIVISISDISFPPVQCVF
jgi:predicted nucleic-acid-binding protein